MATYDLTGPEQTGILTSIGNRITSGVRRVQFARMQNALYNLSDEHLRTIGIKRSEIPEFARKLIGDDRD